MTLINLQTLATDLGIPGERLIGAKFTATPWRAFEPAVRYRGAALIVPDGVGITLVNGVPEEPIELLPNDGTWCWRVTIATDSPDVKWTRYVTVPAQAEVDYGDLIDVNPETFAWSEEGLAAWQTQAAGASAYQIALTNGFVGTEVEWLASLDGADGDDGEDGREVELNESATHIQWRYAGEPAWVDLVALVDLKGADGDDGEDGRELELGTSVTHIQWRLVGDPTWIDLVTLASLKGADGDDGDDGREVEIATSATHIQWRYVGDVAWTDIVALSALEGADGDDGIDATLTQYADTAALDAVVDTELGIVSPATNWGAYTGVSALNDYIGEALARTIAGYRLGAAELTQTLNVGRHSGGYDAVLSRTKFGTAAWTAWELGARVPTPAHAYDATNKLYVDARGLNLVAWASLDTLPSNHGRVGLVSVTGADLGALTGLTEFDGWPGGELWFESYGSYATADYYSVQVQRVWVPGFDGALSVIRRHRDDNPGYSMSAWSAWEIEEGVGGGLTVYADMAALDAVTGADLGRIVLADVGAATGYAPLDDIAGELLVETTKTKHDLDTDPTLRQAFALFENWSGDTHRLERYNYNDGSGWYPWQEIPQPLGRVTYASTAAFDAEVTTVEGFIAAPATNWGAYTGLAAYNSIVGPAYVSTVASTVSGVAMRSQRLYIGATSGYPDGVTLYRRKSGAGAYTAWSADTVVALTPSGNYNPASKFYVDQRSLSNVASGAALDALGHGIIQKGYVFIADLTAYIPGLAGYEFTGGSIWYEHVSMWMSSGPAPYGSAYQRIEFPDRNTAVKRVFERTRTYPVSSWTAWSAWAEV